MRLFLPDDNGGLLPISYFHALARLGEEALVLIEPSRPFVSLGYFDSGDAVDREYCRAHDIPVMRRETGGGMVLLGPGQIFYTLVVKRPHAPIPNIVQDAYRHLSQAPVCVYSRLGIRTRLRPINDIVTAAGRKITGQGAGDINGHFCFVGSILLDFDCDLMHHIVRLPDQRLKETLRATLSSGMTSVLRETGRRPSADTVKQYLIEAFAPLVGGLETTVLPEHLLDAAHAVAGTLVASVDDDDTSPPRTLFKIQEGLYLCQRIIGTPHGPVAVSVTIRDDIVIAVHATSHPDGDAPPGLIHWIGQPFAAGALPLDDAAKRLQITPAALAVALFGAPPSAHVPAGVTEKLEPGTEGTHILRKP